MTRHPFTFRDLEQECRIQASDYLLHGSHGEKIGIQIDVPIELMDQAPFNSSAYSFLQFLRQEIFEFGIIELPGLPLNPTNHTVALRAPQEHRYSQNPYLTESCQAPHQDTPPYPTAFWLNAPRRLSATWIMGSEFMQRYYDVQQRTPGLAIDEMHRHLVPRSLAEQHAVLLNQRPGLVLLDNSSAQNIYHAKTSNFEAVAQALLLTSDDQLTDSPLYAYNEMGLLNHIDHLDEQRGMQHRCEQDKQEVIDFLSRERI